MLAYINHVSASQPTPPLNRGRAMLKRKPYAGLTRQLVLAFDIGTTFSGISFCILQPGEVPQPQGVMKYLCSLFVVASRLDSVLDTLDRDK